MTSAYARVLWGNMVKMHIRHMPGPIRGLIYEHSDTVNYGMI